MYVLLIISAAHEPPKVAKEHATSMYARVPSKYKFMHLQEMSQSHTYSHTQFCAWICILMVQKFLHHLQQLLILCSRCKKLFLHNVMYMYMYYRTITVKILKLQPQRLEKQNLSSTIHEHRNTSNRNHTQLKIVYRMANRNGMTSFRWNGTETERQSFSTSYCTLTHYHIAYQCECAAVSQHRGRGETAHTEAGSG